ncbi:MULTISPECIES: 50S ribosomal protein L10 [Draconibacterium]|uniref:Large ribosomal subunit protein uL10 n=1 Tax=Draconibacterium sediminis TaxID=1544798 RepID=A0A0D8JG46_9BACT|nr:50S ribosomal protein L10 [Draconibacterium sediminis]KJF44833.1 50S ribosomal protein L10 [Draconibacterium sediminis]
MKSSEKQVIINQLQEQIDSYDHFYLTDIAGLNAENTSDLRRLCFSQDVKLVVVKNTLLRKALENSNKEAEEIFDALKGNTTVMFSSNGNTPAKLIKDFAKKHKKPVLKAAYVEESIYMGADQLEALIAVKSKNELIADVVALLQSPMKTVLGQLQSGGNIIHGVLDTLKEKE